MASLPPTSSPAFEPAVGGPVLSAEYGCWWQLLRVRLTFGVAGHGLAVRPDTTPSVQVAGALAVAPRPAERRRRSALPGRGWERPPIPAYLDWRRGGWSRTAPSSPPLRGRSRLSTMALTRCHYWRRHRCLPEDAPRVAPNVQPPPKRPSAGLRCPLGIVNTGAAEPSARTGDDRPGSRPHRSTRTKNRMILRSTSEGRRTER